MANATTQYQPIGLASDALALTRVRAAAARLLTSYFGHLGNYEVMTYTRWRRAGWLVLEWLDMKGVRQLSLPFTFDSICAHLKRDGKFVPEELSFPPLISGWLDASIEASHQVQILDADHPGQALKFMYPAAISEKFPVYPLLDREGRAFSSLQLPLLQALVGLRNELVERSAELFRGTDWLIKFFSFLNLAVAVVENTLHQVYYRAEFEHRAHGWLFDRAKLGETYGRRIRDKFAWIGAITGRPLNTCREQVERFIALKNVRNHIAHFDPPVLAFTIEDVANWLNCVVDVAFLLAEIRRLLREPLCQPLVECLLLPAVVAVPANPKQPRVPQGLDAGYASVAKMERLKKSPEFSLQLKPRHR
jgi:hypothetical protein